MVKVDVIVTPKQGEQVFSEFRLPASQFNPDFLKPELTKHWPNWAKVSLCLMNYTEAEAKRDFPWLIACNGKLFRK